MPRRKRRFETLEDRRLLAALVGPMAPSQSSGSNSAEVAPASNASSSTAADPGQANSGDGSPNDSAEYAPAGSPSAAPSGSTGTASSYDYGSSSYNGSSYDYPANSTDPYSSYTKTPSTPHSTTQPTATTSLASEEATLLAAGEAAAQINVSSMPLALTLPALGSGPSASPSPPAARSPSASGISEQEAGGASSAAQGTGSLTDSELLPPVALASSASDFRQITRRAEQIEELLGDDEILPAAEIRTGSPLAGSVAINFAAIEQEIDDVFDRIERLGDDLVGRAGATRFAEWLVIAGGACAAFEYARIRLREGAQWQAAGVWPVPYEPRLRRRWFPGRSRR